MRRREIPIELTSLLDVILIILFVLLMQAKTQTGAAAESNAAAEAALQASQTALSETEAERDALRERVGELEREGITLGVVEENSLIITLSVQGMANRTLLIEQRDGTQTRIPVEAGDENYVFNRLHSTLTNLLGDAGNKTVFVVFQYDRNAIYQSEYLLIGNVMRQVKQEAGSAGIGLNYIETDLQTG